MILNGKKIADNIYARLQIDIGTLPRKPKLGAVLLGDSPASMRYIKQKRKFAEQIGMEFELFRFPEDMSQKQLLEEIQTLNTNNKISGYIVQLPLPTHIDSLQIISAILPQKDVDGFHPENQGKIMIGDTSGFSPCTPAGVIEILKYYQIGLRGKNICILGRSNIVGKPLTMMCINQGATVTCCNSTTKNINFYTQAADIIICATGQAHILSPDMTSETAVIIDVGFSVINEKIYGDAQSKKFLQRGNPITPVPGGVGPMTVAMLMQNTYLAHTLYGKK